MSVERIQQHFRDSAALTLEALETLTVPAAAAVDLMFSALANGNRILVCGHGGSAAHAQYFASQLVGCFERERPALPALALGADAPLLSALASRHASDDAPGDALDGALARQVHALGQPGDVLLAIAASGYSPAAPDARALCAALASAHERDMTAIALTGNDDGEIRAALAGSDLHLRVSATRAARVHETHLLILHCLCDGIDAMLLGVD